MNNFYGLAEAKSELLPKLMLRLSDLMRYSLYGTKRKLVRLSEELTYINNYIELEKIRLENTLKLEFKSDVRSDDDALIAPLILIVFVENAFKHSRNNKNNEIDIKIQVGIKDIDTMVFKVGNYYNPELSYENSEIGGIGIENVRKRLNVIYPNQLHQLIFEHRDHYFEVTLTLNIDRNIN
jgi:LytS/YehU family sensor histidine kinase